ncbi:carboxypeptidase-like regulatory domain-containing protein [Pedobacter panaciterrae]|uniref:Carboxypeptidase-like regulatory domain-containing protein n=1 Tax=Pedobacter panaciterrae TaxID=363849 RepID=A0ABU8NQT0_9SPHI|nr:carboxypeptidase-like regulatory domain-containing protein [Pedobacter panaciterrae]NQX54568.1 Ig-like domain-containing protein [Pedobacter panaciterrae]
MKTFLRTFILPGCLFLFACSKGVDGKQEEEIPFGQDEVRKQLSFSDLPERSKTLIVSGTGTYVNLMENQRPKLPDFRSLDRNPNILRGFVKDIFGRPVKNAEVGVRSSIAGGFYSSATGLSDQNGYYEVNIPVGNTEIWGSKVTIEYQGGRAFVSLFPADSTLSEFRSSDGAVKNFVLLPYGNGRPDEIAKAPQWPTSYVGGSIHLSYNLRTETLPLPGSFPIGSVIVVKLMPVDLVHAEERITFIIKKEVLNNSLYINNIPLGKYNLELSLSDGRTILIQEGINLKQEFGLSPKQAEGKAALTFIPGDPECLTWFGNWKEVPLNIELK